MFTTLAQQLGSTEAENHLSKSIFTFVIGSNDIFAYDPDKTKLTTQQYAQSMVSTLQGQLKVRTYWLNQSVADNMFGLHLINMNQ